MIRSRPLQVLLLLTCGVTAAPAGEPNSVLGAGTTPCNLYVQAIKDPDRVQFAHLVVVWVQGYFSARNAAGRMAVASKQLTVGGTMSADTLQAMLADQCNEEKTPWMPVVFAAEALYDKLQAKGL